MLRDVATTGLRAVVTATALALCVAIGAARASFHTFQISELYSSPDGGVQFVELREVAGLDGQDLLAGHTLTSVQGAVTRTYTFPTNLPSSVTAGKYVLIATQGFANLGIVMPDYIMPAPFLFPGGGTVNYAAIDPVVYPALPADGVSSVSRTGTVGINSPTNFAGQTATIPPAPVSTAVAGIPALAPPMLALLSALLVAAAGVVGRSRRAQT